MELNIKQEALLKPLQLVAGAIEKRQTMPILSNVLLDTTDGQLVIRATDNEIELVARASEVEIITPDKTTVSMRKLMDICRLLPNDVQINLSLEKNHLILSAHKSRFKLATLPAENFPNVSESAIESEFTIAQNVLKNMITKTHFSMGQKDVRFFLNGMLFDLTEDAFHVVSSDGHRLSNAMWRLPVASPLVTKIIVPRKGVMELTRILADTDQEIKIMVSSNHLRAETENFTFISRLLDGKFPDYRQVVGLSKDKIVTVEREKLKEVLIRASVLSSEKSRGVRLLITPDILKIFTSNTEQEEAYDELPISYYGAELEICFNVNYLLDACNALQDEKIELRFSTDNSSVHIVGNDAAKYVYVVMPIKI